jgi:predicted nucleotidyltransferase
MTRPAAQALDVRSSGQIDDVIDLVRMVLGEDAVAAYLYGSAVQGGLKPSSDLDVFLVTRRPTTPADKRALVDGLLPISGSDAVSGPARSIELTVVVQSDVRPWRYPPRLDFLYGDWLRREFERGDLPAGPRPNPDLAMLLTSVLLVSRPLFGPPAEEVFDPVPRVDLERALLDVIPGLLAELPTDTRNVILTLARIWTTMATGEIRSKDAAADWALARLPAERRSVLARARAIYLGDEAEDWQDLLPVVDAHAEFVVHEIVALSPTA